MNKITFLLLFISGLIYGQQATAQNQENTAGNPAETIESYNGVEFKPEFPGGINALYQYVGNNFKRKGQDKGTIILSFVVDRDGKVVEVKILRGINRKLDKEAIRLMEDSPVWKPAMQNGKLVRCSYQLPIKLS